MQRVTTWRPLLAALFLPGLLHTCTCERADIAAHQDRGAQVPACDGAHCGDVAILDAAQTDTASSDRAARDVTARDGTSHIDVGPAPDRAGQDLAAPPDTGGGPGDAPTAADRSDPDQFSPDTVVPPADASPGSDRASLPDRSDPTDRASVPDQTSAPDLATRPDVAGRDLVVISDDAGTLACGDGLCVRGLEDCERCPADCGACMSGGCGNNNCGGKENCINCVADCGRCPAPVCGDHDCNGIETCATCEVDCGVCPFCGDTLCNGNEDCNTCNQDCGACPFCGDNTCNGSENCLNCEQDCGVCPPSTCGDLVCQTAESTLLCPADCGYPPGTCNNDGTCQGTTGENCTDCGADCNVNDAVAVCGNGECEGGEAWNTCPADCGPETWPALWRQWEAEVVVVMNQHRAAGTDCPSGAKSPVPALTMESALQRAAELHAWDMGYQGYFAHTSCNGRTPWQRAAAQGTSADAENIAWGYGSPTDVVSNGWMTSTSGHCDAIMNGGNSVVGIGYARGNLWVAMFR